jgi:type I restriction enzyme M protein
LIENDELLVKERTLLKVIEDMQEEVLANAGVDAFEEVFKLVFAKLFDELETARKLKKYLEFRNDDTENEVKNRIQAIFDRAKAKWKGVFLTDAKITLSASHLAVCASYLQNVKLFNSNLDVIDEAFEFLINKDAKGDKGQYFTPRYVIDMCVKMLNPKEHESIIDTAAGSCGFPIHGVFHVWKQILAELGLSETELYTAEQKHPRCLEYVRNKVFAIDFDEKAVRVARTLNLIAGDGESNVLHLNSLDYDRWYEEYNAQDWLDVYGEGWKKIKHFLTDKKLHKEEKETERKGKIYVEKVEKYNCRDFQFDVLMANPPFAGEVKESRILNQYDILKKNGKTPAKVDRHILFIERNLDMLAEGGRLAVVLPQGIFNNSSDKFLREFVAQKCRILAVVGLHGNVFKPYTGTKTSVILL